MSTSHPEQNDDRQFDQWIDLLAGEERADAEPHVRREATALRRAIVAHKLDEEQAKWDDPLAEARFIRRARKGGGRWVLGASVLAIAATVTGVFIMHPGTPTDDPNAYQVDPRLTVKSFVLPRAIAADDPPRTWHESCDQLRSFGLEPKCDNANGKLSIELIVPKTIPTGAKEWLRKHGASSTEGERHLFVISPKSNPHPGPAPRREEG